MRLIEFGSPGCPFCAKQKTDRVMERLAATFRSTQFTRVDTDVRNDLADLFKVDGLPVYCLVDSLGRIVDRVEGAVPYEKLAETLKRHWAF